jgi:hypothetical protein
MNSVPKNRENLGLEASAFVILLLAWLPIAIAKCDQYWNGPGEDRGLEMLLAMLWLGAFLLFGIVLSIRAANQASKRSKSPALPFLAILLYVGSIFFLFLWWVFFE